MCYQGGAVLRCDDLMLASALLHTISSCKTKQKTIGKEAVSEWSRTLKESLDLVMLHATIHDVTWLVATVCFNLNLLRNLRT